MNQFSHYSKEILKSMNTVEGLTGKMFQETNKEFETKFWLAHDNKDIRALRILNEAINKTIDGIKENR